MGRRVADGTSIHCLECDRPWGVLGADEDDMLIDAWSAWLDEWWETDVADLPRPAVEPPPTRQVMVAWVGSADIAWLADNGIAEFGGDGPCWVRVDDGYDLPRWWLRRRARPATTWATECCSLDLPPHDLELVP